MNIKYPRTHHLPWSKGATSDDKILKSIDQFKGRRVIVTEKMDGENSTLTPDSCYARSVDSGRHESRTWLKSFWGNMKHQIPAGYRICGENLFAKHSIHYENLESYFLAFSVWEGETCLSWDDSVFIFDSLKITPVRIIADFVVTDSNQLWFEIPDGTEGYVVRVADSFHISEFPILVGKCVRANHVTTSKHWMYQAIVPNKLKITTS